MDASWPSQFGGRAPDPSPPGKPRQLPNFQTRRERKSSEASLTGIGPNTLSAWLKRPEEAAPSKCDGFTSGIRPRAEYAAGLAAVGRPARRAKRMLWFMAKYANGVAKEKSLGIRYKAILPMQIIGGTEIGDDASIAYAKAMGIERGPFLARFGARILQVAVKSDSSAGRAGRRAPLACGGNLTPTADPSCGACRETRRSSAASSWIKRRGIYLDQFRVAGRNRRLQLQGPERAPVATYSPALAGRGRGPGMQARRH